MTQMLDRHSHSTPDAGANGAGPSHTRIAIVGSGFGGLGTAIKLREQGIDDFVILERHGDVGGTWHANTYPGCQCDIPSHLYSFSFAPNPEWSRTYATQPEIWRYLRDVAERYDLLERIRFDCALEGADWDEDANVWRLDTAQGPLTAEIVIAAPGGLSEPSLPDVEGLDGFTGKILHTAQWDGDYDFRGKRIAVVGTGASAIQAVPQLQQQAEQLTLFQRTPPWIVPHRDRPISERERRLYRRFPALQRIVRGAVYWRNELLVPALVFRPRLLRIVERVARGHIASQVTDPALREKLTPDYTIGCKRILPSNLWYPALQQPNVDVAFGGLRELRGNSVVLPDGEEREVDAIVFATGFYVTEFPLGTKIRGRDGKSLTETWGGSPQAYRGTAATGFPNLFWITGPNTGLGHNSIVFMIESQLPYLMDAIRTMDRSGANRIEVRAEAQRAYNDRLQRRLPQSVWNSGGCQSWYIDANGNNTTIWPDFTWRFRQENRRFDAASYELTSRTRLPDAVTA
jgi:cation diffusion facilitator CzcD-associated flavoprotein CzcO